MSSRPHHLTNQTVLFLMDNFAAVKGRVLDVGCGYKPYKRMFDFANKPLVTEWVGLDSRPVGEIQADAEDMPLVNGEFDTVLCTDAIQWFDDPREAMLEMVRVLKPGGTLIVTFAHIAPEDGSMWRFTPKHIKSLFAGTGLKARYVEIAGLGTPEGHDYATSSQYGTGYGPDFKGWLNHLDDTYPLAYGLVGTKENPNG